MTTTDQLDLSAMQHRMLMQPHDPGNFVRITRLAARALGTTVAAISMTDTSCQWMVARIGSVPPMVPRPEAPSVEVVETRRVIAIPDLRDDPRYSGGILVAEGLRFYAGAPLVLRDGRVLGSLCVLDPAPRVFNAAEMSMLGDLAVLVMNEVELRETGGRVDALSGLPNRYQLFDVLERLAAEQPGQKRLLALVDLAKPAELSHMLQAIGSAGVDDIVRQNAGVLAASFGASFAIFHVAATQFALLAPPDANPDAVARRLCVELPGQAGLAPGFFPATSTSGLAMIVPGEAPPEQLLQRAHAALAAAQSGCLPVGLFSSEQDTNFHRTLTLLTDFAAALAADSGLRLHFQPRLELATGRCVGAEALLRWSHPTLGEVPPSAFIPIVERTTLVRAMMRWVLAEGLRQLVAWRDAGLVLRLSLNVSPTNLQESDFAEYVIEQLRLAGLPHSSIELEVTESALLDEATPAMQQLRALSAAGISIAIDDFGTGYSSLSYLQRLPADIIKIDQSFIRDLTPDGPDEGRRRTLVAAMIALSHDLGYRVVAEGIETKAAAEMLRQLGCDEVQGYFYARPMRPEAFFDWFARRPWLPEWRHRASDKGLSLLCDPAPHEPGRTHPLFSVAQT